MAEANGPGRDLSRMERFRETLNAGRDDNEVIQDRNDTATSAAYNPHSVLEKNIDALWPFVSQVLGVVQTHEGISRFAVKMVLTRSHTIDTEQLREFKEVLTPILMQHAELARLSSLSQIIDLAYDELIGISVLGPLWRDDEITEILVDAWNKITIEKDGALQTTSLRFRDKEHARKIARDMALKVSDRALTPASPLVTAELPGARVAFAIDKVVKSELSISMRKFRPLMNMDGLLRAGALNEEMRDFLSDCIQARANVLVSGGTGTGKTTMINALSTFIPHSERVITIEDAYELALDTPHWVALQTKESSSADDEIVISMADLLVTTLRMRPDRIIVGEIREPRGASVMLQAANTGHDGTMTTIHANSADRALNFRMVGFARTGSSMTAEVAAAEVSSAINLVVQVVRRAGRRFITEIAVVDPSMLHSGLITPLHIFKGELIDGKTSFTRCGAVDGASELGMKLEDEGLLVKWDL